MYHVSFGQNAAGFDEQIEYDCDNEAAYHSPRLEMYYCPVCHRACEAEDVLEKDIVRIAKGSLTDCKHCVRDGAPAKGKPCASETC